MFGTLGFFYKVKTVGSIADFSAKSNALETVTDSVTAFSPIDIPSTIQSINIFGWEIRTPTEWAGDKLKEKALDMFLEYLTVLPIVFGVSAAVYLLLGMFSKTLGKWGAIGCFLYSVFVFIFT